MRGAWRVPWTLAHGGGLLYMIEDAYREAPEPHDGARLAAAKRWAGHCVLVLSPADGRVLQVFRPAGCEGGPERAGVFVHMCAFGDRLLCAVTSEDLDPSGAGTASSQDGIKVLGWSGGPPRRHQAAAGAGTLAGGPSSAAEA